ncbi:MAG: hypothetical protein KGV56_02320 [Gammaproteobacteria bacterium]|nr:hypothetical protein [Gammaproteobacteria bacterium]
MTYKNLITIKNPASEMHFKEALDIALVSASYEMRVAVFIDEKVIENDEYQSSVELAQSFNMLAEFSVPLFSDTTTDKPSTFYNNQLQPIALSVLQKSSKHQLVF